MEYFNRLCSTTSTTFVGPTDTHYYLNLDRCAYGGIRHTADRIDGTPIVRGAQMFAVDHNCSVVYYHSTIWKAYRSSRNIRCNSHP